MKYLIGSFAVVLALSFLIVSCKPQGPDPAEVKKKIEEMDAKFMKAFNEKDLATLFFQKNSYLFYCYG